MGKKENIVSILQGMGYTPQYDDDGDVYIIYQMKHVFFLLSEDDEDNYISIMLPQFVDLEEGEESMALAVCNKMTREFKLAKFYLDKTFKSVTGTCEAFYANNEALEYSIKKSLRMISCMRSQYYQAQKELT
ncbi:MAG: YbjN domain-containing protein [Bacteroidales bacterium]|nr:YbjN domain-containing protein [Candidatus Liminaster caballi]